MKILLVDDDKDVLFLIREAFINSGVSPDDIHTEHRAWKAENFLSLSKHYQNLDLVVMDYDLGEGEKTGVEILKAVGKIHGRAVILTALEGRVPGFDSEVGAEIVRKNGDIEAALAPVIGHQLRHEKVKNILEKLKAS